MNDDQNSPTVIFAKVPTPGGRPVDFDALPWFDGVALDDPSLAGTAVPRPGGTPGALQPRVEEGRLHDEGEIARGGMGQVHRVYDAVLRRRVALKALHPAVAADPALAQRFVDEARITGALAHPNIVPVHDLVTDASGRASYTMRLVQGRTLTALIGQQSSRRDLERILQCVASVCDALAYAHSQGIVHRDIKPDNIMVGDFGEVYLMDWGCALDTRNPALADAEPEGSVVGSPSYMAPEQARGEIGKLDARTDVFAIGAILYKALTGQAPYSGRAAEALAAARIGDFRPPDACVGLAVKPPPMLTAIVKKAMSPDPARRHQSAADLAEDLRDFLRGGNWYALHVFKAGREIVSEGDWADAAYIITSGRCEVRRRDPKDPRQTQALRVLEAGDVFGETAIFADAPRSASVVALEDVHAVVVDRASLEQLAESTYLGKFVKALAQRFLEAEGKA